MSKKVGTKCNRRQLGYRTDYKAATKGEGYVGLKRLSLLKSAHGKLVFFINQYIIMDKIA